MRPNDNGPRVRRAAIEGDQSPAAGRISATRSLIHIDPRDEIAHHVDGTFVLVVRVTGGKYRRRCFLSAASAERAARNALEAGHNAEVFLAELKPLWKLSATSPNLFDNLDGEVAE
jgi:hypothetical protein